MKKLVLTLVMIMFSFPAYAGSIQMSVKDTETDEEKTIIDEEVYSDPSHRSYTPVEVNKKPIAEKENERREKELETLRKDYEKALHKKERADKRGIKAAKSRNQNQILDATATLEVSTANREYRNAKDALDAAMYGSEYVEKKREERQLRSIDKKLDRIERTQSDMKRKQDYGY